MKFLLLLLLVPFAAGAQVAVDHLPLGGQIQSSDYTVCDQSGVTNKCPISQLSSYFLSNIPLSSLQKIAGYTVLCNGASGQAYPAACSNIVLAGSMTANSFAGNAFSVDQYGNAIIGGSLNLSNVYHSMTSGPLFNASALYFVGNTTGTVSPIYWSLTDQVNAGTGLVNDYTFQSVIGGYTTTGSRNNLLSNMVMNTSPNTSDPSTQYYVSTQINAFANAPVSAVAFAGPSYSAPGDWYGSDDNVALNAGATNWGLMTGHEIGVTIAPGGSASDRFGLTVYAGTGQGVIDDNGIGMGGAGAIYGGAGTFKYGIEFGGARKTWPFSNTPGNGIIIGATSRSYGGTSPPIAYRGVDFQQVAFASCAYDSPGYCADPNGQVFANGLVTTGALTAESGSLASVTMNPFAGVTGGAYTAIPTLLVAAPPGGGTQAAASVATMNLSTAQVTSNTPSGAGCTNGGTLTVTGVTGTAPTLTVTSSGGIVSGVAIASAGSLSALSGTYGTSGGGCTTQPTLNLYFGVATVTINAAGSGYPVNPPLLISTAQGGGQIAPASFTAVMTATAVPLALVSPPKLPQKTVATLPTCNTAYDGALYEATDTTTPTYNGALTGGGAVKVPVMCNGSVWTSH